MLADIFFLLASLVVILVSCEAFTNAIEWFGRRLDLAEGAVGSVLAAVGTAMPETLIPLVAILLSGGQAASHQIGIGAIVGAPFMLSTLALFVNGVAILFFHRTSQRALSLTVNQKVLSRDLIFFLIVYGLAVLSSYLPNALHWVRYLVALGLLGFYGFYILWTLADEGKVGEDLMPLHFARSHPRPRLQIITFQVIIGLLGIIGGAKLFVIYVEKLSLLLGTPPLTLSLIIAPIATELPEKFNSVLWVRRGKDTLAMGNITGAMVFQSAIPTTLGILLTSWVLDNQALLSATIAMASAAIILLVMRLHGRLTARILLLGGLFYALFILALVFRLV
jgi:cation:H+ antiporter